MVKDMENMEKGWRRGLSQFKTTCNPCTTGRALVLQSFKDKPCSKPQKGEAQAEFLALRPWRMERPVMVNQKASELLDPSMVFACHEEKQG